MWLSIVYEQVALKDMGLLKFLVDTEQRKSWIKEFTRWIVGSYM